MMEHTEYSAKNLIKQAGVGRTVQDRRWLTRWQTLSRSTTVFSACSTAPCHRPVTRATTVLLTRRVSSTLTTLRSMPTLLTSSSTTPGPGGVQTSATSSERHIANDSWVNGQRPLNSTLSNNTFARLCVPQLQKWIMCPLFTFSYCVSIY